MPTARYGRSRFRSRFLGVMVFASLLGLSAGRARAEDPQHAKELFQQGTTFFDLGQFDKAIEAWQEGYKNKPDPGFLFNIAQAYRLAGDAQKAIFFYKGYLRHSPKATNRTEVEQKIAALQKQTSEPDRAKAQPAPPPGSGAVMPAGGGTAPAPPPGPPPPVLTPVPLASAAPVPPPPPGATAPAPVEPPPPPDPTAGQPEPSVVAAPPPIEAPWGPRPVDLSAAIGTQIWATGVQGNVQPSFAVALAGGYTFGSASAAAVHFRLGAFVGFTSLNEQMSPTVTYKETFASVLLDPSLRVRLVGERLSLGADLGIGVLAISGLKPNSSLLDHTQTLVLSGGAQGLFELRPAVGVQYRLHRAVELFAGPAIEYSPKKVHFHAAITRIDLLAGLAIRL
jgi:hypothetical protein